MEDNNNEMFQRNPVLIGTLITLISYFFGITSLAFLVGAITVGFMIGTDLKKGAINGTIMGLISLVISIIISALYIMAIGYNLSILNILLSTQIVAFIIQIILSIVGGAIGSMVRAESKI